MTSRLALLVVATALLSCTARSGVVAESQVACDADETTIGMRRCLSGLIAEAQAKLDELTAEIMEAADESHRLKLEAARTAWNVYVRAECRSAASVFEGGTAAPVIELDCMNELIRARLSFFERAYRPLLSPQD